MTSTRIESLFERYKGLIKSVIRKNRTLLAALRIEDDDAAQELSIAMLSAIKRFDPEKNVPLEAFIAIKLQYAVLNMKRRYKPHGVIGIPQGERISFTYLDAELPEGGTFEISLDDDTSAVEVSELINSLSGYESNVIELAAQGYPLRRKAQTAALRGARNKYNQIYKNEGSIAA